MNANSIVSDQLAAPTTRCTECGVATSLLFPYETNKMLCSWDADAEDDLRMPSPDLYRTSDFSWQIIRRLEDD